MKIRDVVKDPDEKVAIRCDAEKCTRCGECCKVIPLSVKNMHPNYRQYLRNRGLKEDQGFILIPHECEHLVLESENLETGQKVYACDIWYDASRPFICRKFVGQKQIGPWMMYIPEKCGYRK